MVNEKWGIKRTCSDCTTVFYDMKRPKILCPKCGAAWQPAAPLNKVAAFASITPKVIPLSVEDFTVAIGELPAMGAQDLDDLYGDLLDADFNADEVQDVSDVMESGYFYKE